MKDTDEEVTGEYQIPEMESTVPGCAVFYKAFLQSAKNDNLTDQTTPIALVDTLTIKRTLKFKVNRELIGVNTLFFIEAYIPKLTA